MEVKVEVEFEGEADFGGVEVGVMFGSGNSLGWWRVETMVCDGVLRFRECSHYVWKRIPIVRRLEEVVADGQAWWLDTSLESYMSTFDYFGRRYPQGSHFTLLVDRRQHGERV